MISVGDGLATQYIESEPDSRLAPKAQEGWKALAEATRNLLRERFTSAEQEARNALELFREGAYATGAADSVRVVVKALIGLDKIAQAEDLAKGELAIVRQSNDGLGEAKMLLSLADLDLVKGGEMDLNKALQSAQVAAKLLAPSDKSLAAAALRVASGAAGEKGLEDAIKAKDMCESTDDKSGEGASLLAIAHAHAASGKFEEALVAADEATDIYMELKDKRMEAISLMSMAQWRLELGLKKKALYAAEEAYEILQTLVSPRAAGALTILVSVQMARGHFLKARKIVSQAAETFQEAGNSPGWLEALTCQAHISLKTENFEEALFPAERALKISQGLGDRKRESELLYLISEISVALQRYEKAVQVGENVIELLQDLGGDTQSKASAMFTVAGAHLEKGDPKAALNVANEMLSHFRTQNDPPGEAAALMAVCAVQFKLESFDQAASAATKAQMITAELGDTKGEGQALRMIAEVHWEKSAHMLAIRAAERARTLFREAREPIEEVACLYTVAQNAVCAAVESGAKVGDGMSRSKAAVDALAKGTKAAENAAKLARELPDEAEPLLASSLCVLAQTHMFGMRPENALDAADEAVGIFREHGDFLSEASALLLSADALRAMNNFQEAREAASEALSLFQRFNDERGEDMANLIIGYIEEVLEAERAAQAAAQQQQQMQWMAQQGMQFPPPNMQAAPEMPEAAQSIARVERERGPALDMSAGLGIDVVKDKVLEIAMRITGAEDGEIEADTPLMEAGLTSNSAILLRDELTTELPGVNLPVTLVFDYPSISAMSELIVENSKKKAIKR